MIHRGSFSSAAVIAFGITLISFMAAQEPPLSGSRSEVPYVYICPMHADVRSVSTGECPRCKMSLVKVALNPDKVWYSCPLHPGYESTVPGTCSRCGAPLAPKASLPQYKVELRTVPEIVQAGRKIEMHLKIFEPNGGKQVQHVHITHEKPIHFFVISDDLLHYQHIHPVQQPDGSFLVETVLPEAGRYEVIADFVPLGGWPQVVHQSIATAGFTQHPQAALIPDRSFTKTLDGIRFELAFDPVEPTTGLPVVLNFRLTDADTGLPVRDLQPYLGAWGHTVILSEDAKDYLHSHPRAIIPGNSDRSKLVTPDEISFDTFFPRPGRYRIWSQFQRGGKVTTVSFTLDAARLDPMASWDGKSWSALSGADAQLNGVVRTIAVKGNDVYVGGDFTEAGSTLVNGIAKWDGRQWSALGEGVNGNVWSIALGGNDVYIGGEFTKAGEKSVNRIARWNGSEWLPLGSGVAGCKGSSCSPGVYALAFSGNDLYAGGKFLTAGGTAAGGIARWTGKAWTCLGAGMRTGDYDGIVRALAADGSAVYAGGNFKTAGSAVANNIAKWNGHAWSALGNGVGGGLETVLALALGEHNVYAGGDFSIAGNAHVSNGAVWNGHAWRALGVEANAPVTAMAVKGSDVYLGGASFTLPSGEGSYGILRWNSGWSAFGSGVGNSKYLASVQAIGIKEDAVYVGGGPFALPNSDGRRNQTASRLSESSLH